MRAAPKIMAECDDGYKRIFGWETPSDSAEYKEFLTAFLPSLIEFLKSCGNADERAYFHISDEPKFLRDMEYYKSAVQTVKPLIGDRPIIDAMSDFEFYSEGLCSSPVSATNAIEPFIENNVENLWCYYCEGQSMDVSNRFIALPSYRNRILGVQLYKYGIEGFLHYGYNYYYNRYSYEPINPYLVTDGDMYVPAGDCFVVYPSPDGEALPSIRLAVLLDAFQDIRALQLCEKICGREKTLALIEEQGEITFKKYPHNDTYLLNLREKINHIIKETVFEGD